ncbi:MAG: PEP-CTERM sorting domain-containing protein [Armatimonadota bacterium]
MKKLIVLVMVLSLALAVSASADIIAQWNFNTQATLSSPSTGTGTMSFLGNATAASSGAWSTHYVSNTNKSSDPIAGPSPNQYGAYNTANYITIGSGVAFAVSTVGYENITVSLDAKRSGTGPSNMKWIYSTDGSNWIESGVFANLTSDAWFNGFILDLSSISAAANNPNFIVGFVSNATYGSTGTIRYDMVTISGDQVVIPEPGTIVALGSGLVGIAGVAIRRRK